MNQRTQTGWIVAQGTSMIVLGLGLFYVRATMTTGLFAFLGSILSMFLMVASLLFIVVSDVICMTGHETRRPRVLRKFLWLSAIAASAGIVLILFVIDIQGTCWLFAAYSLMVSVAKIDLALHWRESAAVRAVLYGLAAVSVLFGCVLAGIAVSAQDARAPVSVIGAYSLFMGTQLLLTIYFVRRGILMAPNQQQPV